ncbi:hypothetical protein GYA49_04495 [Candidatus Beckwithbacteria bacterium]|nr:hypothetical protein [Candidatus Beckwithbacteria bacterium]
MKNQDKIKALLLERLRKIPIVQVACEKTGVSRATYYRWQTDDSSFAKECDKAILEGRQNINDMAESKLVSSINDKNMSAIRFWLNHHHSAYSTRVEVTTVNQDKETSLSKEERELLDKAIEMVAFMPPKTKRKKND